MSDWADEEALNVLRSVHGNYSGQIQSKGLVIVATALRAAERKGMTRAKEAAAGRPGHSQSSYWFGREDAAADIQSLIDKPETEEKR